MKSTYYLFLCLCIPLFALTSCENDLEGDNFGQDTERYDIPLTSKSAEVNAKVQKFSFDFYREMARRQKADFCISPLSVNLCLGMVLNGADGNTYKGCLSQESGTLVYEPIKAEGPTSGHVLLNTTGENCFIDLLTGETIVTTEDFEPEDIEYSSDGLFIIHYVGDNGVSYLFYDSEGNPVQPVLSGN